MFTTIMLLLCLQAFLVSIIIGIVLLAGGFLLVCTCTILIVYCCCRHYRSKRRPVGYQLPATAAADLVFLHQQLQPVPPTVSYTDMPPGYVATQQQLQSVPPTVSYADLPPGYAATTDQALSQLQPLPPYNEHPPGYVATEQQLQPVPTTIRDMPTTDLAASTDYVDTTDLAPTKQQLHPLPPYNDQSPGYVATEQLFAASVTHCW